MSAAVTSDNATRTIIASALLLIAFAVTPVGVYRVFEDGRIDHPVTLIFFVSAGLAASAPIVYAFTRFRSWRRWVVIALDLPFILLVLLQIYRMATRNV